MAYPTVSAPYGLKPVNLIGGQVFAGATRLMEIASGYATNIFYGDLVKRVSDGTIEKDTGTTTATPCGVFLGVQFTNGSTGQVQQQQHLFGWHIAQYHMYALMPKRKVKICHSNLKVFGMRFKSCSIGF